MGKRRSGLIAKSVITLLLGMAGTGLGGCAHTLFTNSDNYTDSRLERYWGGDSARASREASERGSDMTFSPTGGGGGGYQ